MTIRRDPQPKVSAILVSWNTAGMTCDCLDALAAELDALPHEVILVDNASSDDTLASVAGRHPGVQRIANDRNLGFGAANNRGLAVARGELLLLINTDAFVEPGCVAALVRQMDRRPELGVTGPRLLNADRSDQACRFDFPTPWLAWRENLGLSRVWDRLRRAGPGRGFASGACFVVRRAAYEQVGGFDESFFMYSEETDWQGRVAAAGWRIGYAPEAVAVHLGGGSQAAARLNPEFFRSLDRYQLKHHGRRGLWSFRTAMAVGAALRLPVRAVASAVDPRQRAKLRVNAFVLKRWLTPAPSDTLRGVRPSEP
ncbi:MAG: glycosyltransferase family 2 protein [Planctomycetota bacterium]